MLCTSCQELKKLLKFFSLKILKIENKKKFGTKFWGAPVVHPLVTASFSSVPLPFKFTMLAFYGFLPTPLFLMLYTLKNSHPIHFVHCFWVRLVLHQLLKPQRHNPNDVRKVLCQLTDGDDVQMVVMVVGDEDNVNLRTVNFGPFNAENEKTVKFLYKNKPLAIPQFYTAVDENAGKIWRREGTKEWQTSPKPLEILAEFTPKQKIY